MSDTTDEVRWKTIDEYPEYKVSSAGEVSGIRVRILKGSVHHKGYRIVTLKNDARECSVFVHRLVATAFCDGRSEARYFVNHKDGNKLNNDSSNLEWCTPMENHTHAIKTGLIDLRGQKSPRASFNNDQVREIRSILKDGGVFQFTIAEMFGVAQGTISRINCGKSYANAMEFDEEDQR